MDAMLTFIEKATLASFVAIAISCVYAEVRGLSRREAMGVQGGLIILGSSILAVAISHSFGGRIEIYSIMIAFAFSGLLQGAIESITQRYSREVFNGCIPPLYSFAVTIAMSTVPGFEWMSMPVGIF